jgi:cytochrome oxidase assembly protein ShyY1
MLRGPAPTCPTVARGPAGTVAAVLRFLLRPRWLALTGLVLLLVPLFLRLSQWQYDRHLDRRASADVVRANIDRPPAPLADVLPAATAVTDAVRWRQVTLTGRWDADAEVLVRNRPFEGRSGLLVVTPLVPASGPALLVARGHVPAAASATDRPDVPAAQPGEVTVVARLRPGETPRSVEGLPPGQVLAVDPDALADELGYPLVDGYGELVSEQPAPADAPTPVEGPSVSPGPHLSYAVQWVLFALLAVGGWVMLAWREVQTARSV